MAPASSNKGRWAAKRLCGLSGGALDQDLPVMHKEGSAASLVLRPRITRGAENSPCPPFSWGLCRPRSPRHPLATTSPIWCQWPLPEELVAPKGVWGSRVLQQEDDDAQLLLKAVGNGDLSGKGGSRTWLNAKSESHPKPAGLISLIPRDERHWTGFLIS